MDFLQLIFIMTTYLSKRSIKQVNTNCFYSPKSTTATTPQTNKNSETIKSRKSGHNFIRENELQITSKNCYNNSLVEPSETSTNGETKQLKETIKELQNQIESLNQQLSLRFSFSNYLQQKVSEKNAECDSDSVKFQLQTQATQEILENELNSNDKNGHSLTPKTPNNKSMSPDKSKRDFSFEQLQQIKEKLEVSEQINEWLRGQLQKITNYEDWMLYRQLFSTVHLNNHNFYFKNAQKKQFFRTVMKQHTVLQNLLEIAEVNESNLELALNQKMAEQNQKEKQYQNKIIQLEEDLKNLVSLEEVKKLEKEANVQKQVNSRLNEKYNQQLKASKKLQRQNEDYAQQIISLKDKIRVLQEVHQNYISETQNNSKNKEAYYQEIEIAFQSYKSKQDKIVSENRQLRVQFHEYLKTKEQNNLKIKQQDILISNLQYELDMLSSNIKQSAQNQEDVHIIQQLEDQLTEFSKQLEKQIANNKDLTNMKSCLEFDVEGLKEIINKQQEEIKKLRNLQNQLVQSESNVDNRIYFQEQKILNTQQIIDNITQNLEDESKKNEQKALVTQIIFQNSDDYEHVQNLTKDINMDLIEQLDNLTNQMNLLEAHLSF